ncbi:MAG: F0F1 ATP synthase subunit delta [Actinomycetota bacterium]
MSQARPGGRFSPRGRAEEVFSEAVEAGGGVLPRVRGELFALADLLRREPQLRKTLADIGVPPDAKRGLLRDLLGDRLDERTLSLLEDLVVEDSVSYRLRPALEDLAVQAVLAEAEAEGSLERVAEELFRLSRLVESEPALRSALTDPVLPDERKAGLMADLLEGKAATATVLLARWTVGKTGDPVARLRELSDRAAARDRRMVVEARTAVPLDEARQARLGEALTRATGRRVDVQVVVDPSVVGGVVARVGDEVIDGSIRRKLQLALERLTR